jgi:hypothetical protein
MATISTVSENAESDEGKEEENGTVWDRKTRPAGTGTRTP